MIKKIIIFSFLVFMIKSIYAQTEITLKNYFRTLKAVKVEIEDKTYNFLFDTGAGITMVSPKIAKELNKSAYGNNIGFRMNGEKIEMQLCDSLNIKIGGIIFFHPYVAVFDIMSLLPSEFQRIDGMISLKTFENNQITLNLSNNQLIVETDDSFKEKIKKMKLIPSRFANGNNGFELNIFIGLKYQQHLWWFLFDTGNILAVKISQNIAKEWGLEFKENEITELGNFNFEITDDLIAAPTIIDNIIHDGALSFDFIQQSEFTISFTDQKVWKSSVIRKKE